MDRASDSGSEGWGFESLPVCHKKEERAFALSSFLFASGVGLERLNRNMPVAYCCNQFKNWLLP